MMRTILLAAAALTLAACNNSGTSDIVREIERGEKEASQRVEDGVNALSNAVQEEPQTFPSGLELQFIRRGHDQTLAQPTMAATVLVHYEGSFVDGGEVFDSSFARGEPTDFPLRAVVPGFSEALANMRPGDEAIATFPGALGYGASGRGPIPPNAALRFRIVLLGYIEPGGEAIEAQPAP